MADAWNDVEGFQTLADWFGSTPTFHDGQVLSLDIDFPREAVLVIHAWRIMDRVDADGYFETEQDFVATIRMGGVTKLDLETDYDGPGIVSALTTVALGDEIQLQIYSSLGVEGRIKAQRASIAFLPGKPEA
jgi:hypothetical protein